MTKAIAKKMLNEVIEEFKNTITSNRDKLLLRHLLGIQYILDTKPKRRLCARKQCGRAPLSFLTLHECMQHDQYVVFECVKCSEQYIEDHLTYDEKTHICHRIEE